MYIDYLEIGTADFDCYAQSRPDATVLAVEPVKHYLDRLPDRPGLTKVNYAIGEKNKRATVHYLCMDFLEQHPNLLPNWLRGCSSIGKPHPSVVGHLKGNGFSLRHIKKAVIPQYTVLRLFTEQQVTGVGCFKVDAEGMDCEIVRSLVQACQHTGWWPDMIQFEANSLAPQDEVEKTKELLQSLGYSTFHRLSDVEAIYQHKAQQGT